jgi:sporulation protein YlmC with PRC-barrel domain
MSTYPGGYAEPERRWERQYGDAELYQRKPQHLTPSKRLGRDWEVVEGPEIHGWDLLNHVGERIGQVDDVVVDTDTGRSIFAIVSIGGAFGIGGRKTLLPIHLLDLNVDNRNVTAPLSAEVLSRAPEFAEDTADLTPFYDFWDQWLQSTGPAIEEQEARQAEEEILFREETIIMPGGRIRVARYRRIEQPEERHQAYG